MLNNGLWTIQFPIGEAAIYALIGFLFVFCGIVLLILIFTLLGMVMKKVNEKPKKEKKKDDGAVEAQNADIEPLQEGVSPEVVAAITAAIACYYSESAPKCGFVVRRIKKL